MPTHRESPEASTEWMGFLSEVVASGFHVEGEFFDGDVVLAADALAPVSLCQHVEDACARELHFVFCPDGGSLMVGGVVAGSDSESVVCTFGCCYLHFLLILQPQRCAFLAGQVQPFQFHFRLSVGLEDELSVITLPAHKNGEFVRPKSALDAYVRTIYLYAHAVLDGLFHFGGGAIVLDGDVFCLAYSAYEEEC